MRFCENEGTRQFAVLKETFVFTKNYLYPSCSECLISNSLHLLCSLSLICVPSRLCSLLTSDFVDLMLVEVDELKTSAIAYCFLLGAYLLFLSPRQNMK